MRKKIKHTFHFLSWPMLVSLGVLFLIILLHSPWVERYLINRIQIGALNNAINLKINDLEYNLLTGNMVFSGVKIESIMLKGEFDQIRLNSSWELLMGDLIFDYLAVLGGTVEISEGSSLDSTSNIEGLPEVHFNSLTVEGLKVKFLGQSQNVNFKLSDCRATVIEDEVSFDCGMVVLAEYSTLSMTAQINDLPVISNIEAELINQQGSARLSGFLAPHGGGELSFEGDLHPDGSSLTMNFSAEYQAGDLQYQGCLVFKSLPHIQVRGATNWRDNNVKIIPLHIEAPGFLDLDLIGVLDLNTGSSFSMAGMVEDPGGNRARVYVQTEGRVTDIQNADVIYHLFFREGQTEMRSVGAGHTSVTSTDHVSISSEFVFEYMDNFMHIVQRNRVKNSDNQPGRNTLDCSFDLHRPEALLVFDNGAISSLMDSGNVSKLGEPHGRLVLRGISNDKLVIQDLLLSQDLDPGDWVPLMTPEQNRRELTLQCSGPIDRLRGKCYWGQELELDFQFNLNTKVLSNTVLKTKDLCLDTAFGTFCIDLKSEIKGSVFDPEMVFSTDFTVHSKDPVLVGNGAGDVTAGILHLSELQVNVHQCELSGSGFLDLVETQWGLDFQAKSKRKPELSRILDFDLPDFTMGINGGPLGMETSLDLDTQDFSPSGSWFIPVDTSQLIPSLGELNDNQIYLGGLLLEDLDLEVVEGIPQLRGKYAVLEPDLFANVYRNWMFEPLVYEILEGSFQLDLLPGTCFGLQVEVDRLHGRMYGEELNAENWSLDLSQGLGFSPLKASFAGTDLWVTDSFEYHSVSGIPSTFQNPDLSFAIAFDVEDRDRFNRFGRNYFWDLPRPDSFDFDLKFFELGFEWKNGLKEFQLWAVLPNSNASYLEQFVQVKDATLYWGKELLLDAGDAKVNGLKAEIKAKQNHTRLEFPFQVADITRPLPQFFGNGDWLFKTTWHYEWDRNYWKGKIAQESGQLFHPFPRSEVTEFELEFEHDTGLYTISSLQFLYNGGSVKGEGRATRSGENTDFQIVADRVGLDFVDYQITSSFKGSLQGVEDKIIVHGDYVAHEGYLFPAIGLMTMVQTLYPEYPQLNLPDQRLEKFGLEIHGKTETPILIDHPLAYLEVEVPDLVLKGTLAAPKIESGEMRFLEGSELNLRNEQFVFKPSQIQFNTDHPEDPFFQIALEQFELGVPKQVQMIGYLSDILRGDSDTTDVIALIASYMLGQVSSMINLETESNESVFDTDFSLVLSKTLGRRLITRYVVPLDNDKAQEFLVGYGPYAGVYASYTRDEMNKVNLSKISRFGFPGNRGEEHVRNVVVKTGRPVSKEWVKANWKMQRGDIFSETRLRQAKYYLEKELKNSGYLDSKVLVHYQDRVVNIDLHPGPLFSLEPHGLSLASSEKKEILRRFSSEHESATTSLRSYLENLIVEKGYLPGSVEVRLREDVLVLSFHPGKKIKKYAINFGHAQGMFKKMVRNKKWVKQFIKAYLKTPTGTRSVLKSLLAARGYVTPKLGKGSFDESRNLFSLLVTLGPRANCGEIKCFLDGELLELESIVGRSGKPFDFDLIESSMSEVADYCQKSGGALASVTHTEHLMSGNIQVEIQAFSKKDRVYKTVDFFGNDVLENDSVSNLILLKLQQKDQHKFKRTDLVEAQKRLVRAGQFSFVSLHTDGQRASFELQERNRFDLDYGSSWSDETGLGVFLQFKDRMFLKGPHDLVSRLEFSEKEERFGTQFKLRNLKGMPGDLVLILERYQVNQGDPLLVSGNNDEVMYSYNEPLQFKSVVEFRFPLSKWNRLQFGVEMLRQTDRITTRTYPFDSPHQNSSLISESYIENDRSMTPLKFSWSHENLNNYMLPRSGSVISVGAEFYQKELGNDPQYLGQRLTGNWTVFLHHGSWLFQQRLKGGTFFPKHEIQADPIADDPILFYLGGGTDLRGFERNSIVPYSENGEATAGGQVMLFSSSELTYITGWYGFGISPFLDAGQVWEKPSFVDLEEMVWTSGLGLVFDTPVAYFRLDYVYHLSGDMPEEIKKDWHFRIGRVF